MNVPYASEADDHTRREMCEFMRHLEAVGLNRGTSGNLSVRLGDGFVITPSGVKPGVLQPGDVVAMSTAGAPASGAGRPSSEWRFHRDIYLARSDAGAVVHVHSPHATALACRRRGIPAFHYMIAVAGGDDVRCAPYATFGTQALSDAALAALSERHACLLANHGMIALGATLGAAVDLAVEVEELARQYLLALTGGTPVLLDRAEMDEVIERFKTYGKRDGES